MAAFAGQRLLPESVRNMRRFEPRAVRGIAASLSDQLQDVRVVNARPLFDPTRGGAPIGSPVRATPFALGPGTPAAATPQSALGSVFPKGTPPVSQVPGGSHIGPIPMGTSQSANNTPPGFGRTPLDQARAATGQRLAAGTARPGAAAQAAMAGQRGSGAGAVQNLIARAGGQTANGRFQPATPIGARAGQFGGWAAGRGPQIGNLSGARLSSGLRHLPGVTKGLPRFSAGVANAGLLYGVGAGSQLVGERIDNSVGSGLEAVDTGLFAGGLAGAAAPGLAATPTALAAGAGLAVGTAIGESSWYQSLTGTEGNRLSNVPGNIMTRLRGADQRDLSNHMDAFSGLSFSQMAEYLRDPEGDAHLASWMASAGVPGAVSDGNGVTLTGDAEKAMSAFKQTSTGDGGGLGQALREVTALGWDDERIDETMNAAMEAATMDPAMLTEAGLGAVVDENGEIDLTTLVLAVDEGLQAEREAVKMEGVEQRRRELHLQALQDSMAEYVEPAIGMLEANADLAYEAQMANLPNLPPEMQGAMAAVAQTERANRSNIANAYRAQIAMTPAYLARQSEMEAAQNYESPDAYVGRRVEDMYLEGLARQTFEQQYPEFASGGSDSLGLDLLG